MAGVSDLPDINVWLAVSIAHHPDHQRARQYWADEAADRISFCRVTALGLVRLASNRAAMAGQPLTIEQAWQLYLDLRALPEVALHPEPAGCETMLGNLIAAGGVTHRLWTDAYLAAFAMAGGLRLISFDGDFERFGGLDLLLLDG